LAAVVVVAPVVETVTPPTPVAPLVTVPLMVTVPPSGMRKVLLPLRVPLPVSSMAKANYSNGLLKPWVFAATLFAAGLLSRGVSPMREIFQTRLMSSLVRV